jgi:hypothetical protein
MSQDTGLFRKNTNDQFYTAQSVAKQCFANLLSKLDDPSKYYWIEPSAGNGVFLKLVPQSFEKIGLDIDPKDQAIIKQNFLQWKPSTSKDIIVFGNPPFGRQASTAKQFIKYSSSFAKIIAFILPLSFVKPSMNKTFPINFHCIFSQELSNNSFVINGQTYDVPCVFQIWEKRLAAREILKDAEPNGFKYIKPNETFDIAFRRVGVYAGKAYLKNTKEYSSQSHYFIRFDDKYKTHLQNIIEKINLHTYPENTVGPRSISKPEVNEVINQILLQISS